ncbi:hypothetical protein SE938_12400, partial [Legionella pneumophila]|nr:hypothetical protein [Legionella pneumophila]
IFVKDMWVFVALLNNNFCKYFNDEYNLIHIGLMEIKLYINILLTNITMIIMDIVPTPDNFKIQAINYLIHAIDLLYKSEIENPMLFLSNNSDYLLDSEEHWLQNQTTLLNALAMLFLSVENYLKTQICTISPYLLIAKKPSEWNKDFKELHFHSFEDLIELYERVFNKEKTLKNKFDKLRRIRNIFNHGLQDEDILPNFVINYVYDFLTDLWGIDWVKEIKKEIPFLPDMSYVDNESYPSARLSQYVYFIEKYLGKRKIKKLLGMGNSRRYICPSCIHIANVIENCTNNFSYASLDPNTPDSTLLRCFICDKKYKITRGSCIYCPGNVLFTNNNDFYCYDGLDCAACEKICLTCGHDQRV